MNSPAKTLKRSDRFTHAVRALFIVLAASLSVAGCAPETIDKGEPPLKGARIGGDFTLTSSTGETVRWADFRGRYAIVYFGYAYCPDVCPTSMQRTTQGLQILKERNPELATKIQPIFITVDPARDTEQVVGEFTAAFSEDLIGLTGSAEAVKAAADNFAIFYQLNEPAEEGAGYLVDHIDIVYLFDPAGEPLAMLPTSEGPDAVADTIETWAQ